jgi:hypothetical protein
MRDVLHVARGERHQIADPPPVAIESTAFFRISGGRTSEASTTMRARSLSARG